MNREEIDAEITVKPFKKSPFAGYLKELERRRAYYEKRKIDYEFQEIGLEMQKWFGKNIWWIFWKPEAELQKVKEAFKICQGKKVKKIQYLLGILKKMN